MEILKKVHDHGYPTEYLLSRIQGRSAGFISDWRALIFSDGPLTVPPSTWGGEGMPATPDGVWQLLSRKFTWAYHQMNSVLHDIFRPFFEYYELGNIFRCLRYKSAHADDAIRGLLVSSLLSEAMKRRLLNSENLPSTIERIQEELALRSGRYGGLSEMFRQDGLRGVERFMTDTYLEETIDAKLHLVVREFFSYTIDSRNIMVLAKHLRWDGNLPPRFIRGGRMEERFFVRAAAKKDTAGVGAVIRRLTGRTMDSPLPVSLENSLLTGMKRFLHRARREPSGVGRILDYLWRCSLEARNLSTILTGREIGKETLAEEVIV
jgi:vacuolar-type H+-ATPase subunit C/Vma6